VMGQRATLLLLLFCNGLFFGEVRTDSPPLAGCFFWGMANPPEAEKHLMLSTNTDLSLRSG
jgi:hypothetical protein